jgi:hypothetical protein
MTDRVAGGVMSLSIRMRLTLWNASVLALVLGTFAVAGWLTLTTTLRQRTDTAVRESARVVAGAIRAERAAAQARGDVEEVRGETEQAVLRELRVGDLEVFIADEGTQLMAARQPGPSRTSTGRNDEAVMLPEEVRALLRDIVQARAGEIADEPTDCVLPPSPHPSLQGVKLSQRIFAGISGLELDEEIKDRTIILRIFRDCQEFRVWGGG